MDFDENAYKELVKVLETKSETKLLAMIVANQRHLVYDPLFDIDNVNRAQGRELKRMAAAAEKQERILERLASLEKCLVQAQARTERLNLRMYRGQTGEKLSIRDARQDLDYD